MLWCNVFLSYTALLNKDRVQIFLSPQVKRCAVITCKHGIYELPQELLNDLRFRILGNWEISGKCLNFIEW